MQGVLQYPIAVALYCTSLQVVEFPGGVVGVVIICGLGPVKSGACPGGGAKLLRCFVVFSVSKCQSCIKYTVTVKNGIENFVFHCLLYSTVQ